MLKDEYKTDPNKVYETEGHYGRYFAKMATIIPPTLVYLLLYNVTLLVLPLRGVYFLSPRIWADPVICLANWMWLKRHCTSLSTGLATSALTLLVLWVHYVKTCKLNPPWGLLPMWKESQCDSQHQPSDIWVRPPWTI